MRASGLAEATPGVDRAARLLECGLALIFYWFGFLKLFPHVSPAEELGGGRQIALPGWLSPGTCEIRHRDEGSDRFNFTLTLSHPRLGRLVHQVAYFKEIR